MGSGVRRMSEVLMSAVAKKVHPVAFPNDPGELPRLERTVEVTASRLGELNDFWNATDRDEVAGDGSSRASGREATAAGASATSPAAATAGPAAAVPPALLHALCFPATIDLLTSPAIPVQPLGLVVTSQSWHLLEPVHTGESLQLGARVSAIKRSEDGVSLTVECTLSHHGAINYVEATNYLSRSGSGRPSSLESEDLDSNGVDAEGTAVVVAPAPAPNHRDAHGVNEAGRLDIGQRPALTTAHFTAAAAKRWAELTGDANPIHLSAVAARAFGYRKVLLHGAAIDAWVARQLGITGERPSSGAVSFRAPVLLPADLELVLLAGQSFAVVEKLSGRDLVHLSYEGGTVEGVNPGAIVLPRLDGRVSSTMVAQGMCAGAASGFPRVRNKIEEANPWRRGYREAMEALSAIDAPQKGPRCARDGLEALHSLLHFADGRPSAEARLERPNTSGGVIVGDGEPVRRFGLRSNGESVHDGELLEKLRTWTASGTMQLGASAALSYVVNDPGLLDLSGYTFVCVGAGAELSPAPQLLGWGGDVAAVMRPGTERARKLQRVAGRSAGRMFVPPDDSCDVVQHPERVAGWVADLPGRLVIVETLYAPGAQFLLAAAGADIVERLACEARPETMLAWIGSPTDAYLLDGVPIDASLGNSRVARVAEKYAKVRRLRRSRINGVYPGFVDVQGPSYAAAKRVGRWRATVERATGRPVSYNVGPMSLTRSVLDSGVLRAAYAGMEKLGMPALPAETSASLMAGLLVWDLKHPGAAGGSDSFLTDKAVDSGLFSSPYEPHGLMGVAVALGARHGLMN